MILKTKNLLVEAEMKHLSEYELYVLEKAEIDCIDVSALKPGGFLSAGVAVWNLFV